MAKAVGTVPPILFCGLRSGQAQSDHQDPITRRYPACTHGHTLRIVSALRDFWL